MRRSGRALRFLVGKDLRLLRRSPLLVGLLVVYPLLLAVLIGFAVSRAPDKPRVAFLNEVPESDELNLGNGKFDLLEARDELFQRLEVVRVKTRAEAVDKVQSGEVLGALIVPADIIERLRAGLASGALKTAPQVEVIVNRENPVKAQLVDDRIDALLAEANLRLSREFTSVSLSYLTLLLDGGDFRFLGQGFEVLGLRKAEQAVTEAQKALPDDAPEREQLAEVARFARLAQENLDLADDLLASIAQPIQARRTALDGDAPALDTFAIAVAATVTLMFVTILLVAGSLALEREENTLGRLRRGLASPLVLLTGKLVLGVICALAVTLLLFAGLGPFVALEWSRLPLWVAAIVFGAAGFAALGAAIGGLTRDLRAASLLAFMVAIPLAFLSLIPSGAVGETTLDVLRAVTAAFPFRPAFDAMQAALAAGGDSLLGPLVHLAILTVAYTALARLGLRRLA
ncbi:MAG: ABC transporter permease [Solirubrobacterales bacterium]